MLLMAIQAVVKIFMANSYKLEVTVTGGARSQNYIRDAGFILDFKELKRVVTLAILNPLDHQIILSRKYLDQNPAFTLQENLVILGARNPRQRTF